MTRTSHVWAGVLTTMFTLLGPGCYVGLPGRDAEQDEAGDDDDGGSADDDGDGGEPGGPNDPEMTFSCDDENRDLRGLTYASLRRLSKLELEHTLADLLGDDVIADEQIASRIGGLPPDQTIIAGDFATDPPVGLALAISSIAQRAADLTLADPAWVSSNLPPCVAAGTIDEACAADVATEFGSRVWRRDLDDAEVDQYVVTFTETGGGNTGLTYLMRRLLQAPSLVFHIEDGDGEPDASGRLRLTPFEVASRISYGTVNSMPDAELLDAARSGELDELAGVEAQVRRLLDSERAQAKVSDFFRYYTRLTSVADPLPSVAALHGVEDATGLGEEMQEEAYEFFDHIVWSESDFGDLMGSTAAFPRSALMASVFETEIAVGDEPVESANHPGLLHRPALMASGGPRTSPILRGAHVRKLFLCDELGMPDPAAVEDRQEELGDIENMTNRERIATLTDAPTCSACHGLINPVGFSFEGYDQLGAARSEETIVDEDGNIVATWPLNTMVEGLLLEKDAVTVADSIELSEHMVASYKARACIARRAFEYYRLAVADYDLDGCGLLEREVQAHQGTLIDVFVVGLANEDIFWRKAP